MANPILKLVLTALFFAFLLILANLTLDAPAEKFTAGIQYCLYVFGQMAAIAIAVCVFIFYLLKLTRMHQYVEWWLKPKAFRLQTKVNTIFASLFPPMENGSTKTSSSKYVSTTETTNLARVARLILGPCTDLLRDILRKEILPPDLSKKVKTSIDEIKKKKMKNPLNRSQVDLIFPLPTKQYSGDYSEFDISLLYVILRNVCNITSHTKGWGNDPDPTDKSVSANIERIRLTRNKYYGHASDFSLSESDFFKEWQNIYNITVELEGHFGTSTVYQDAVYDIKTCSMDPEMEKKYIDKLLLLDEVYETVKKHSDEIKELQSQSVIPKNVKAIHEDDVKQWKEDDKVFHESHNFPAMLNKVKQYSHVTFVGVPGSGKTATAHHIALMLQQEGYEIVPIKDITKIEDYCDLRNPQVFLINDVVGVFGLQEAKLNLLSDYQDRIIKPIMSKSKTLMTCREAVYRKTRDSSSFFTDENNTVLLHSDANALSNTDKKNILKMYNIDVNLLSSASLTSVSKMFPYLCKLFSTENKFQKHGSAFFENPVPCILEELDEMKKQNKIHYASLVLCMMNKNKLSEKILEETEKEAVIKEFNDMKRSVLRKCKVSSQTESYEFVDALSEMEGTYTKLCGPEYTFVHDSMFEIVAYHFGSQFPDVILQYVNSSYIANNVKLQKCAKEEFDNDNKQVREHVVVSDECIQEGEKVAVSGEGGDDMESFDLSIRLKEDQYPILAERLYRDIEDMELYDVFMNSVLKDPKFCQAFIAVLMTKSYTELKSVFLSVQKDVSKVMIKRERVIRESKERYERRENKDERRRECLRQEVLLNQRRVLIPLYYVRVISWVVLYGHNQILQYILKQTELHKETLSDFFFFHSVFSLGELFFATKQSQDSFSEIYRLLLLSCYSGDLETVRIFLKYLDKKVKQISSHSITPLIAACEGGHMSVMKELIEAGADVNREGQYDTPLTAACRGGHMRVVKELLEAGADVNRQGKYDTTPLTAACKGGHISVAEQLICAGANVNMQDFAGKTPLCTTVLSNTETLKPIVLMLNSWGADPTICDREGLSALYIALVKNKGDVVKLLLQSESKNQCNRLKLHLFDCLVNLRHSDVMADSKDDVVVTQRQVWHMGQWEDMYKTINDSKCDTLKHLVGLGLDVNQWIELFGLSNDVKTLLFSMIDEEYVNDRVEKVKILLGAGVDINIRVRYRECDSVLDRKGVSNAFNEEDDVEEELVESSDEDDVEEDSDMSSVLDEEVASNESVLDEEVASNESVLDREGVSVLERTWRLVNQFRKYEWKSSKLTEYKCVFGELKKHVRRYSV